MARFQYEEMVAFLDAFALDARLQKTPDNKDAYVITRHNSAEIIAEFVGNPVGGYEFTLYANQDPNPKKPT